MVETTMPLAQVDWIQLLQTFGLAVVILFAVGMALWQSTRWFGREIVLPLRDKALARFGAFLTKIEATIEKLDVNVDTVTDNLERQTLSLRQLQETNAGMAEGQQRVAQALEDEHGSLKAALAEAVAAATARHELLLAEIKEVKAQNILILARLERGVAS